MPTQVVLPSVSLAAVPHGTAFTVLVEIPSSPTVSKPAGVPGLSGLPTGGAAPTVDTLADGGAVTSGGDPVAAGVCCCASADEDKTSRPAKIMILRISCRLKSSEAPGPQVQADNLYFGISGLY